MEMDLRKIPFSLFATLALSGCVAVQPMPPRIERLADGVADSLVLATARPLSLAEVIEMARIGTPANVIIQTLRDARVNYSLSSTEAGALLRQGVPYEVVEFMRHGEPLPVAVYSSPTYYHPPTYPSSPMYPDYVPYVVVPGIFYSRWSFGHYPRFRGSGFSLRFGIRR